MKKTTLILLSFSLLFGLSCRTQNSKKEKVNFIGSKGGKGGDGANGQNGQDGKDGKNKVINIKIQDN